MFTVDDADVDASMTPSYNIAHLSPGMTHWLDQALDQDQVDIGARFDASSYATWADSSIDALSTRRARSMREQHPSTYPLLATRNSIATAEFQTGAQAPYFAFPQVVRYTGSIAKSREESSLISPGNSRIIPSTGIDERPIAEVNPEGTDSESLPESYTVSVSLKKKRRRRKVEKRRIRGKYDGSRNDTTSLSGDRRKKYGNLTTDMVDEFALFPQCPISFVEVETFYGRNECPTYLHRVFSNGITLEQRAKVQMNARGFIDKASTARRHDALKYWASRNGSLFWNTSKFSIRKFYTKNMAPVTDYDASHYVHRCRDQNRLWPPRLLDLAHGVKMFPQDHDAGILTQSILYAVRTNNHDLTVSDVPEMARKLGFAMPTGVNSSTWDQEAIDRILRTTG